MTPHAAVGRKLIALDIDGTITQEDGTITQPVRSAVARAIACGHEVMLATGRSAATTFPVLEHLQLNPEYLVCSNGASILKRDSTAEHGYRREHVETFNPGPVLTRIRSQLSGACFAVEDQHGFFRYTDTFPDSVMGVASEKVIFEDLLSLKATRVVVISPGHDMEDFLSLVERMGLHRVSYAIGWTAWLDIAPDGVNKSVALERVRNSLMIPRTAVVAVGDGRNDIEMLQWAGAEGVAVVMGQAPQEVHDVATQTTASVHEDGLAHALLKVI